MFMMAWNQSIVLLFKIQKNIFIESFFLVQMLVLFSIGDAMQESKKKNIKRKIKLNLNFNLNILIIALNKIILKNFVI